MSYDPRLAGQPYGGPGADDEGGSRKGSVRAARERLQAAQLRTQLPDTSKIIGLPMSQYSTQNRYDSSSQPRSVEGRGVAPLVSPPPQWPLSNDADDTSFPPIPPLRSPRRLQAPQQIIRPISDDYPIQQPSPEYPPPAFPDYPQAGSPDYNMGYRSDDTLSPYSSRNSRPLTTSSGISESSSLGSIPDFPVPQPPLSLVQQNRRTPSLGPPPSSRRGPSSYYTQMSYVSPIVEEAETRSNTIRSRHGSFASSNVFPINDDYYPDDLYTDDDDDDETITSDRGTITPTNVDDRRRLVEPSLVRQASLGKRTKPSLMTIKAGDSSRDGAGKQMTSAYAIGASDAMPEISPRRSPLGYGTGLMDPSSPSSDSAETIKNLRSRVTGYSSPRSPDSTYTQEVRPKTLADRVGSRRPPRLDVNAVRDAESRGSLTSLPDLIRRATRLAANLDRGKTASRLGLDFWEAGAIDRQATRQSGMTDMLAAFPPPGQDTPVRTATGTPGSASPNPANRMSNWPAQSPNARSGMTDAGLEKERPKPRRRCCGMPLWQFIALLIFLLLVIAAAVLLPVILIVIPNQQKNTTSPAQATSSSDNSTTTTTTSLSPAPTATPGSDTCSGLITCQNGGVAILNADRSCNCVCVNGFTGRTCTVNDNAGCTTFNLGSVSTRATIGTGIPRLIQSSASTFNIPLNATLLLGIFSDLSLSCAAENALITFNGLAARSLQQYFHSVNLKNILQPTRSYPILDHPHMAKSDGKLERRQDGAVSDAQQTAAPSPQQMMPVSSNATALDFARASVLLALQVSGALDSAANAQQSIQNFLTNNRNGNAVGSMVDVKVFTLDLVNLTIQFKNGTKIHSGPVPSPSPF